MGPFITVPIADGGALALGGPLGGRPLTGHGMRGRGGRGGYGGRLDAHGSKHYYDLDAPENQRSVLDYGDL